MKKSIFVCTIGICVAILLFSLSSCERTCQHPHLTEQAIDASCDQEGKIIHTCSDCGAEYATDITPPKGHRMQVTLTTAPTCELQGYSVYSCADCDYSYLCDYVPPLNHALNDTVIAATCATGGYTRHSCERCDYHYDDNPIPAGNHTYSVSHRPVTCLQSGYSEYHCESCSYHYKIYAHYSDLLPSAYVSNTTVLAKGLDVSKYNHKKNPDDSYAPLDWTAIKNAGFDYVILKIGSTPRNNGTAGGLEPTFEADYAAAKAAGLDVGVYFFTYADSIEQNQADADLVADWLEGKQLEYPVYYDIENDSFDKDPSDSILPTLPDRKVLTEYCTAFISRMQEKGFYCGLYTNRDWLENNLDTARCTALFDIWYARYRDVSTPYPATEVFTWTFGDQLAMWQYACTGTIEGFENVYFDFNYTYKDFPAVMEQFHLNGY